MNVSHSVLEPLGRNRRGFRIVLSGVFRSKKLFKVRALVDDKRVPKHLRDALEDLRATIDCRAIAVQTDEGVKIICLDCNIDGMSYNIDNLRYSHFRSSKHMNADPFRALHLLCSRSARSDSSATAYARTFGTGVTPLTTAEDPAWGSPLDDEGQAPPARCGYSLFSR